MSQLVNRLEEICSEYRWQEKLLLAASRSQGHMLLEMLARQSGTWLNLRPITIAELAYMETEAVVRQQSLRVIDEIEQMQLIGQALAGLYDAQQLTYFLNLYQLGVLEPWVLRTVAELRLGGISSADLASQPWEIKAKGRELTMILGAYEQELATIQAIDQAGLYRRATEQIQHNSKPWLQRLLLIPDQLELPSLAQELLQAIPSTSRIYLPQVKVTGLTPPVQLTESEVVAGNGIELLYTGAASLNQLTVDIMPAYGRSNEVRTVLRQIRAGRMPLDTVLLAYTDTSGYARLTHSLLASQDMPATFAAGIMIDQTAPGRLLLLMLEWIEQDYSAALFQRMLIDGYLDQELANTYSRIWLEVGVGHGRENYLPALLRRQNDLLAQAETKIQAGEDLLRLQGLVELCQDLFSQLGPPLDSRAVNYAEFCVRLANCLQRYAGQDKAIDREALVTLSEVLQQQQACFATPIPMIRALRCLRQAINQQSVAVSGPRPGHLHVCHYREGEWCDREHTYVIGLDADTFPGAGNQDPILLDEERRQLDDSLALKAQEANNNLYRLTRFLANRRGQLTLLYASYDPHRFRTLLPCGLVLQVFRLVSGQPEADYTEMLSALPLPANYLPLMEEQAQGDGEWWGYWLRNSKANRNCPSEFTSCYPGLTQGIQAELCRASNDFTSYDGRISDETKHLDYREQERAVSASLLEAVGRCPFAYFLRYVLGLELPPDPVLDNEIWLDPLQMGTLLHDIYCNFGREQLPPSAPTTDALVNIALATIADWRARVPVPNELVFIATQKEIITGLDVFQQLYYADQDRYQPAYFEVPFGLGDKAVATAGAGLSAPLVIEFPDGRQIKLRGRIDRLDKPLSGGGYRVWDYKTGGYRHYAEQASLKQGRQWQPLIYTLAAQAILDQGLDPGAQVEVTGYLFPTRRGDGQLIERSQTAIAGANLALTSLLNLVAQGSFICRHNDEECFFCDYAVVCRFPLGCQRSGQKLATDQSGLLRAWKELQAYD